MQRPFQRFEVLADARVCWRAAPPFFAAPDLTRASSAAFAWTSRRAFTMRRSFPLFGAVVELEHRRKTTAGPRATYSAESSSPSRGNGSGPPRSQRRRAWSRGRRSRSTRSRRSPTATPSSLSSPCTTNATCRRRPAPRDHGMGRDVAPRGLVGELHGRLGPPCANGPRSRKNFRVCMISTRRRCSAPSAARCRRPAPPVSRKVLCTPPCRRRRVGARRARDTDARAEPLTETVRATSAGRGRGVSHLGPPPAAGGAPPRAPLPAAGGALRGAASGRGRRAPRAPERRGRRRRVGSRRRRRFDDVKEAGAGASA